jgi:hypothetical protein
MRMRLGRAAAERWQRDHVPQIEHVSTNIFICRAVRGDEVLHNSFLYKLVFRQSPVIILCSMVIH